jgi:predicted PurR-regulated permease PerM
MASAEESQGLRATKLGSNVGRNHAYYFLLALLFLALFGLYSIVEPYLHSIILGIILALVFRPIHQRIEIIVRGNQNIAAFLSSAVLVVFVLLPITAMTIIAIKQGANSFGSISALIETGNARNLLSTSFAEKTLEVANEVESSIASIFPSFDMTQIQKGLMQIIQSIGNELSKYGTHFAKNVVSMIGRFFIVIFVFFFIVRDGNKIFETVLHLLPLQRIHANELIDRIRNVASSALLGSLLTGLAQGVTGGFAFWVAGLPGLFWGMVMVFASFVPLVGTYLISVPAAAYLILTGSHWQGIFVLVWCAVLATLIDSFLRPALMKEASNTSTLLIFLAILGGMTKFGLLGLLYGPLILGVVLVLLYIYASEMRPLLDDVSEG